VEKIKEKEEKKIKKEENDDDDDKEDNDDKGYIAEEGNKENEDEDFLTCIKRIAHEEFISTFYFGLTETKDYKEKIVFDNGNYPVGYLWDGVCQNAIDFLKANKYPLLTKVDKYLLANLDDDSRTLVSLITYPDNEKINRFIHSSFKNLAYNNRKYVFGYVNYTEDPDIFNNSFIVKLNSTNEILLVINKYLERSHYIHYPVFNIEKQTGKEILKNIEVLLLNISNLNFETGSKFQDFINFLGLNDMTTSKQVIVIVVLILICLGCVYVFGSPEDLDDDLYDYEYEEEDQSKEQLKPVEIKKNE
jgi:hypothetical protein